MVIYHKQQNIDAMEASNMSMQESIFYPNEGAKQNRSCCCKWSDECSKLHKLFASTNDSRGGDPICLDLSGASESRIVWNKLVLKNLNTDAKSIKNMKKVVVTRHHWPVQQLQYFFEGPTKRYPSTPMACSDVKKIAHVVERK